MNVQTNSKTGLSVVSKVLLFISAVLLVISAYIPIWRIQLDAPQYPEGLELLINADGIGGNVDIINGLNHYIGMKTLHNEDFFEFSILRYIILFFGVLSLFTIVINKRVFLNILLATFILFGVVAMVDFWKWEYNYGHNLDPNAAIVVPGMAYQPPLIGFKQLLNFGAYSIPATGGWLFICSGVMMLVAFFMETKKARKNRTVIAVSVTTVIGLFIFSSCHSGGAEKINLNADKCDYCKMTIADARFASELVTVKGKAYKFDDLDCMLNFKKENSKTEGGTCYVNEFNLTNQMYKADSLFFIRGENIGSPMGGNIAGFKNSDSANLYSMRLNALPVFWADLNK